MYLMTVASSFCPLQHVHPTSIRPLGRVNAGYSGAVCWPSRAVLQNGFEISKNFAPSHGTRVRIKATFAIPEPARSQRVFRALHKMFQLATLASFVALASSVVAQSPIYGQCGGQGWGAFLFAFTSRSWMLTRVSFHSRCYDLRVGIFVRC